jgi:thymidylate kinase
MSSCYAQDVQLQIRTIKRPSQRPTGHHIGEIPFFLDVPANAGLDDAEERERDIAELEQEKP